MSGRYHRRPQDSLTFSVIEADHGHHGLDSHRSPRKCGAPSTMPEIGSQLLLAMYETAVTIRRFEQRAIEQYRLGNIRGYLHPYLGEEAIAVGSIAALEPGDYIVSTHRGHGHAIAKGHEPRPDDGRAVRQGDGLLPGPGRLDARREPGDPEPRRERHRRRRARHRGRRRHGDQAARRSPSSSSPSAAMARRPTGCGTSRSTWRRSGICRSIFVLENNQYAVSTPIRDSARVEHLSSRAAGYGMPGVHGRRQRCRGRVRGDGTSRSARARAGEGPTLIECMTYRQGGHHVNDPGLYLPADELERWKARDPLILLRDRLAKAGVDEADVDASRRAGGRVMDEAVEFATASPIRRSRSSSPRSPLRRGTGRREPADRRSMQVPRSPPGGAPGGDGARRVGVRHRRGHRRAAAVPTR